MLRDEPGVGSPGAAPPGGQVRGCGAGGQDGGVKGGSPPFPLPEEEPLGARPPEQ